MTALTGIFAVTFPFFALVLCGYLAARSRVLPLDAVPGLNMFVLYFALPCMLYRFGSRTPIAQLLSPVVALLWLAVGLALVAFLVAWARRRQAGWGDAALGALVGVFPNTGFMGVPLLAALLGPQAVGSVMPVLLTDLAVTTSVCIALTQWGSAEEGGARRAAGRALQGVLRNPMPWSIVLGALASSLQLTLPGPVDRTVALLADSASPVALFTIGAVLARSQLTALTHIHLPQPGQPVPRDIGVVVAVKLLAHPVLIGLGAQGLAALGWLPTASVPALVLAAALPSASNVSLLAERYGADNGRIARIILWSTAAAFVTFSAVAAFIARA